MTNNNQLSINYSLINEIKDQIKTGSMNYCNEYVSNACSLISDAANGKLSFEQRNASAIEFCQQIMRVEGGIFILEKNYYHDGTVLFLNNWLEQVGIISKIDPRLKVLKNQCHSYLNSQNNSHDKYEKLILSRNENISWINEFLENTISINCDVLSKYDINEEIYPNRNKLIERKKYWKSIQWDVNQCMAGIHLIKNSILVDVPFISRDDAQKNLLDFESIGVGAWIALLEIGGNQLKNEMLSNPNSYHLYSVGAMKKMWHKLRGKMCSANFN